MPKGKKNERQQKFQVGLFLENYCATIVKILLYRLIVALFI